MRSLLSVAVLASNLLFLVKFAVALPGFFPPTPEIRWIDYANLYKITGLKLPHINGTIRLQGFKPKGSRLVFNPKAIPFSDSHAPTLEKKLPTDRH